MNKPDALLNEIDDLRNRLTETLEALEAIRSGGVDALVVYGDQGEQVYTLQGADQTYRVMVEAINEGAATISEDGIVIWANACMAEMLQCPLESLIGSRIITSIASADQNTFEAIMPQGRLEKCKTELDLQAQDGSYVPILLSLSPIPDSHSICLIATDLTEHKLNAQIAAAERIAKAIIEQAAEAIVVCDLDGKIVQLSQSALRLAGDNPVFKNFEEAFPLTYGPASDEHRFSIQAVLDGEEFQGVEAALPDPHSDMTFNLYLSAKPLRIPGNGKFGCIITMTDLTGLKQAEQVIRRYARQLERSNKDLENFAFIASHDLQEPLRKIQSFGRILVNKFSSSLGRDGRDYVIRMQEAANRMEKMVNDLLAYSRVGTQVRPYEQVDLNKIVKRVLSDLESRIAQTGGKVHIGELPTIDADPLQMQQLFQNLLSNALKFHKPDEKPDVKVSVFYLSGGKKSSQSKATDVEIEILDNGIGFEMEYYDRIFQPFQRLHGRSEYEGSGIGLPICRRIVERHHGSISATSAPDAGSTFTVILPLKQKTKGAEE